MVLALAALASRIASCRVASRDAAPSRGVAPTTLWTNPIPRAARRPLTPLALSEVLTALITVHQFNMA